MLEVTADHKIGKCQHGCCKISASVLTWNLPIDKAMTPSQYLTVRAWIAEHGKSLHAVLCEDCGATVPSGSVANATMVNALQMQQATLQVWAILTQTFDAELPRAATTRLNYSVQFQHTHGSVAFRANPTRTHEEWLQTGESYPQRDRKLRHVPTAQYHASWWIVSWFWEVLDQFYQDDDKVPLPADGSGKQPLTRHRFCKKNAVRFGQQDRNKNYLAGVAPEANRIDDVVQLTRDLAAFFSINAVSDENQHAFGYKGLRKKMLGDMLCFRAPVAQKIATFLPYAYGLIAQEPDCDPAAK